MTRLTPSPKPQPAEGDTKRHAEYLKSLDDLYNEAIDNNLCRVQRLVAMALRRQVPKELLDHLSYLGRDWYRLADNGPGRPELRVIEGGAEQALSAPARKPRSRKP